MKNLVKAGIIAVLTVVAVPAVAKHSYEFPNGTTLEFDRYGKSKCQVIPTDQMKYKRKVLWNCIGRVSKAKYAGLLAEYMIDKRDKASSRDKEVIRRAQLAILHKDIKWLRHKDQKSLDDLKLAGSIVGAAGGAALLAALLAPTPMVASLISGPATMLIKFVG